MVITIVPIDSHIIHSDKTFHFSFFHFKTCGLSLCQWIRSCFQLMFVFKHSQINRVTDVTVYCHIFSCLSLAAPPGCPLMAVLIWCGMKRVWRANKTFFLFSFYIITCSTLSIIYFGLKWHSIPGWEPLVPSCPRFVFCRIFCLVVSFHFGLTSFLSSSSWKLILWGCSYFTVFYKNKKITNNSK